MNIQRMIRWALSIGLLVVVARNSHWSVTTCLCLIFLENELRYCIAVDAAKAAQNDMKSAIVAHPDGTPYTYTGTGPVNA